MTSDGNRASSGITAISVRGFKSLYDETRIEIRPLTILAGSNSSGKSSIMQPLLLLKQTLEAPFDPGPLLLDGPNVSFTALDQILSRAIRGKTVDGFEIGLEGGPRASLCERLVRTPDGKFEISEMVTDDGTLRIPLRESMGDNEIRSTFPPQTVGGAGTWTVERARCFLACRLLAPSGGLSVLYDGARPFTLLLRGLIHVPAIRSGRARSHPVSATGPEFEGRFHDYFASVLEQWQAASDPRLAELASDVRHLDLTSAVQTRRLNDAQIEVLVDRLPTSAKSTRRDMISIADMGSGVSEVLPILVALLAAQPGQLVYLEEPEANLHPRAQSALADVLADAAKRGVHVVAETHSSLLLLEIMTLVAEGKLSPDLVKLYWFSRDKRGATKVTPGELDEAGRYGDWPQDFEIVELHADNRYLNASGEVLWKQQALSGE